MLEKYEHGMTSYVTRTDVYSNKRHQTSDRIESVVVDVSDDERTCDPPQPSSATVISSYIHIQIHDVC